MPAYGPWEARSRTYRSAFQSTTPQRAVMGTGPLPDSPSFERSGAMVLGPGSYDPSQPTWIRVPAKKSPAFANTMSQRGSQFRPCAADLEYDQPAAQLAAVAARKSRQKWTDSPRSAPYFDTRPRHRELMPGLDEFYAMDVNSMGRQAKAVPRRYAAVFSSKLPARPLLKSESDLGPGSYNVNECTCGGLRVEEPRSPSRVFAPHVGGKY